MLYRILTHTGWLSATIYATILGLEILLFKLTNYNVYRVLDISVKDLLFILIILAIQYILFKRLPYYLTAIWQQSRLIKNRWIILGGLSFLAAAIFSLLPSGYPFWVFFVVLVGLSSYSVLANKLKHNPLQWTILLLLFSAGLNASLIFWMHEEANEGRHIQYARQLAERRDTIAENQLVRLAQLGKENHKQTANQSFWEKVWLEDEYLSSNYRLNFLKEGFDSTATFYHPVLTFDETSTPVYRLYFPNNSALSFKLNKQFRRSVYTENLPFKKLKNLTDYHFAVIDHHEIALSNSHDFDHDMLDIELPPIGVSKKVEWKDYDVVVYHHSASTYVLIGEPLSEFQVWVSNFAFFLSLFIGAAVFWEVLILLFFKKNIYDFFQKLPIQFRMQAILITITLVLFFIIASTTFVFLNQNNQVTSYERQLYIAETLREEILEETAQYGWNLKDFTVDFWADLADRKKCDIDVYNPTGKLIVSSLCSAINSPAPSLMNLTMSKQITKNPASILVQKFNINQESGLRTYFGVVQDKHLQGFVAMNAFESEVGTAQDIPIIMSKLLNVYTLLLLIAWAGGLLLLNLLNKPLKLLATRLSNFKLGKQNEKLNWEGDDVIGKLIQEYNKMVDQVEQTTKELVQSEREGAWQIMAQQIAHEINNPLTPLRLNIQYLTRILETQDTPDLNTVKRITNGLVAQIDHLSGVASQFRLFAKLETPESKPLELKVFLEQFYASYQSREDYQFTFVNNLENDIDPIVNIDAQHFQLVLQNIVANAENAIPENRKGVISIRLGLAENKAVIEITDNGIGIKNNLKENIFDPKFSTLSSTSGLGLPICKRIVEFYGGDLSFTTKVGEGSCFRIVFLIASLKASETESTLH